MRLTIDIICVSDDGNLQDAVTLAIASCFSKIRIQNKGIKNIYLCQLACLRINLFYVYYSELKLAVLPISLTFGYYNGQLIIDPSFQEQKVIDDVISIALDCNSNIIFMNFISKSLECKYNKSSFFLKPEDFSVIHNLCIYLRTVAQST